MTLSLSDEVCGEMKKVYPEKFVSEEEIFRHIHRGDRIFFTPPAPSLNIMVRALIKFVESHPKAFFDAEVIHVWTLGVAPYTDEKFKYNFRHNSFFVGDNSREAVNRGMADYTPLFLSDVPDIFYRGMVPIDVALIQTSPPDEHGYMSLGVSVDITKAAVEKAGLVIAQVNSSMPRVHGDGFIHIKDVDYIICHDEPLLEYEAVMPDDVAHQIGKYVSRIVQDGDTIQVGYGSLPNAILANLGQKNNLGVHSELLTRRHGGADEERGHRQQPEDPQPGKDRGHLLHGPQVHLRIHPRQPSLRVPHDRLHQQPPGDRPPEQHDGHQQRPGDRPHRADHGRIAGKDLLQRHRGATRTSCAGAVMAPGGKTILAIQSTAE